MSDDREDEQRPPEWQQPQWQQPQQPQWQQPQQDPQPQWGSQWGQDQQWGQPQPQPQWGQQQPYYGQQTPGSATAALILGICSLVICGIICGPLAIVYGNRAKREIDMSGGRLGGRGMATAGVIMGWIAVALTVVFIAVIVIAVAASSGGSTSP
jgi:hypothetical protein